jgi:CBS domain-containing protein
MKKKGSLEITSIGTLAGILTRRDIKNFKFDDEKVSKYMTVREKMSVF